MARHSRVFASQAPSGWKPLPFFQVGAAPSFETRTTPRSSSGEVPLLRSAAELRDWPGLVRGLAEQDSPGMANQARPVRCDLQGMVPPVCAAWRRAPQFRGLRRVATSNLPDPARSPPLSQHGAAAPRPGGGVWRGAGNLSFFVSFEAEPDLAERAEEIPVMNPGH